MDPDRLAKRYALLACATHALVISISLFPALRALPLTAGDSITYLVPARNIVEHGAFSREAVPPYVWEPYRTPGYPLCIAAIIWLFGDYKWALYLAAISAACAAWCAIKLVAEWGGGGSAFNVAGLIIAFLPNSLGLSAEILTDAVAGHLTLAWIYFLVSGCRTRSLAKLALSSVTLIALQSFKPTFSIAGVLVALIILVYWAGRHKVVIAMVFIALSFPLPLYLSQRNFDAHGVRSSSLLGMETVRDYLQVRYLQEVTGENYEVVTNRVREEDRLAGEKLNSPSSFYGRLYTVKREKVSAFLSEHPLAAMRLMLKEMAQQFAAPQEFFPQVFLGDLPLWGRAVGTLLTFALWGFVFVGGYICGQRGQWQAAFLIISVMAFFLVTGSVSHFVGARLRFPADVTAIPLCAIGIAALLGPRDLSSTLVK